MQHYLHALLFKRIWLTFVMMGVFFLLFGVTSVNLFMLLSANLHLYLDYGTMVIADGALRQLAELVAYAYLSLTFYVLFKACEHVLVEHWAGERSADRAARRR
jgi:hypothetical protein